MRSVARCASMVAGGVTMKRKRIQIALAEPHIEWLEDKAHELGTTRNAYISMVIGRHIKTTEVVTPEMERMMRQLGDVFDDPEIRDAVVRKAVDGK